MDVNLQKDFKEENWNTKRKDTHLIMKNELNVLYQFDDKYAPYAGVSLTSLFHNNQSIKQINVYLLVDKVSEKNLDKFYLLAEKYENSKLLCIEPLDVIEKMQEWNIPKYRGSYAANLRLFFDYCIKDDIERLLYLDSDTIVCGDLSEILQMDLEDNYIAMAIDSVGREHKHHIGFSKDEPYYNSGVIIYDVKKWKREKCSDKIVDYLKNVRSQFLAPDQDLLNLVFKGKICRLSNSYNYQPMHSVLAPEKYLKLYGCEGYYSLSELNKASKEVKIFHAFRYIGEFPWHKKNLHPNNDIFDYYLHLSVWSDFEKTVARNNLFIKLEKILYKILPVPAFMKIFKLVNQIVNSMMNKKIFHQIQE